MSPAYVGISWPYVLVIDNSDSPSIVEQLSQGPSLVTIPLLMIVPSSWPILCLMPCSWLPAAWVVLYSRLFLDLTFPLSIPLLPATLWFLLLFLSFSGVLWFPFYLGYSPIELWDSLSDYVHPGIACLVSWASDWLVHSGLACLVVSQVWPL